MAKAEASVEELVSMIERGELRLPEMQRQYVWRSTRVRDLLDSLYRGYPSGAILLWETDEAVPLQDFAVSQSTNPYQSTRLLLDGQQRLTTFFLLLCALKHMFRGEAQHQTISGLISTSYTDNNGETRTNLKLEPRYENAGEVIAKLVELDGDPQAVRAGIQAAGIPSFGSLENLVNAYSTIYRYLKDNYDDTSTLKKYWGYLANNVVFIQISTDVSSALKIFETINERGVGLNPMDLLKNLLFTQVPQTQFTQLKDEWKTRAPLTASSPASSRADVVFPAPPLGLAKEMTGMEAHYVNY